MKFLERWREERRGQRIRDEEFARVREELQRAVYTDEFDEVFERYMSFLPPRYREWYEQEFPAIRAKVMIDQGLI